jgi:N-acetylglucosamine-6-phosphate deacetylase
MFTIYASTLITESRRTSSATIRIDNGRILSVEDGTSPGQRADLVLEDGYLVPGLVDIQVNGFYGHDFLTAAATSWQAVARRLPETGVTSMTPTFISAGLGLITAGLRRARDAVSLPEAQPATRILGVHLEGPFLSPKRHGAHDPVDLCHPTPEAVQTLLEAAPGTIAIVTLAPELPGALDAIATLVASEILVAIGHTDATAAQARAAVDSGARLNTHLYNAQTGLQAREPGVVGYALTDPRLASSLVLDFHNVGREAAQIAFTAAPDRLVLVTDAMAAAGMPPGEYRIGTQAVRTAAGQAPLTSSGRLAGSVLRLDDAVAHAVSLGVDIADAIAAATHRPADLLGRGDIGRIIPGALADLVWLDDNLRTRSTWISGRLAFQA